MPIPRAGEAAIGHSRSDRGDAGAAAAKRRRIAKSCATVPSMAPSIKQGVASRIGCSRKCGAGRGRRCRRGRPSRGQSVERADLIDVSFRIPRDVGSCGETWVASWFLQGNWVGSGFFDWRPFSWLSHFAVCGIWHHMVRLKVAHGAFAAWSADGRGDDLMRYLAWPPLPQTSEGLRTAWVRHLRCLRRGGRTPGPAKRR